MLENNSIDSKLKKSFQYSNNVQQTSNKKTDKKTFLFLPRNRKKRDFRLVLINQAVIMAPMLSCRLEGSRHLVTQRPEPRGQRFSQNSTPGRTPWANCPSQCQPFQCPSPNPPLFPLSLSFLFLPPLPSTLQTPRSPLPLREEAV